jgi:hypothetical protein
MNPRPMLKKKVTAPAAIGAQMQLAKRQEITPFDD